MNTRSKMLVILMSIIGVAVLGDQGYRRFIEEPGQKREREIDRLRKQISDADDDILQSRRAKEELEDLEQFSLPSDEELARSRYQDWLLKLVEKVGIQQPSIDAGVPTPVSIKEKGTRKSRTVYQRYGFTVRGRASLDQFIEFLFEFHRAGHLHKIPNMALNPISGGNLLDIGLSIEAIGLEDVSREGELSTQSAHRLAFNDLPSYRTISRRNVFVKESDSSLR
ncbi:MAG: hypothetical protein FJ267_05025, partial [Planctomycetes bacterium]|nr:hypothetical protein [Planctomycetota bacterium]